MNKGKKLSKKELKVISGGLKPLQCTNSLGKCKIYGPECLEKKCQPLEALEPLEPLDPIVID
ncbi:MAG TPA: bacteriocin [Chryseobacterium sp.]|jgi:bacteriocin-like protein|uniref:bacteriocin n=1 Tax=Chryseobacterium lactis TaxID=1241981 RepID=UPI00063D2456|nr:bacteriocin [Chryseobacterium lactis]HCN49704.1 bacteriocin [Chryseobacterium sp.]